MSGTDRRAQLVVSWDDHTVGYYPTDGGWKIDAAHRCVVIGKFPRTYIPLDRVRSFDIEPWPAPASSEPQPRLTLREQDRFRVGGVGEQYVVAYLELDGEPVSTGINIPADQYDTVLAAFERKEGS